MNMEFVILEDTGHRQNQIKWIEGVYDKEEQMDII